MTDSLKERLARGNETMVEALVAITHLESEVEAWAKQTNKELDCNEHLRATITLLQGKLDRALTLLSEAEPRYGMTATDHQNWFDARRSILSDLSPDGGKE